LKAILHLRATFLSQPSSAGPRLYYLRRTVEHAPSVFVPGVDIAIAYGGPLVRIQRVTYCPASEASSVHLEPRAFADDGIGSIRLEELIGAGWEVAK
jgi:hypothetical protein